MSLSVQKFHCCLVLVSLRCHVPCNTRAMYGEPSRWLSHWWLGRSCGVLYVLVWGSERARGCWECGSEDGGHSGSYLERERFSSSFQIVVLSVRRNTTLYKDLTWRSWFTVYTVRTVYFPLNKTRQDGKRNFQCWVGPCPCDVRAPPFFFFVSVHRSTQQRRLTPKRKDFV